MIYIHIKVFAHHIVKAFKTFVSHILKLCNFYIFVRKNFNRCS